MSNIVLNRRIRKFNDIKQREVFGTRDFDIDQTIDDLVSDGRATHVY